MSESHSTCPRKKVVWVQFGLLAPEEIVRRAPPPPAAPTICLFFSFLFFFFFFLCRGCVAVVGVRVAAAARVS